MKSKNIEKIKEKYSLANLNLKKEIIVLSIIDGVILISSILLYIFLKQIIIPLFGLIMLIGISTYTLSKPNRILNKKKIKLESEFVHVFAYFAIFVRNGRPVYNALEDCFRYCSDEMNEKMKELLENIDVDKSVTPYITFSDNFENLEIKQVMVSIYKMSIEGGGEMYLRQFETLFEALASSKRQKRLEEEVSKFSNYNFLPLLASALSMGIIAVAVLILMEGYSNVL